MYMVYVGARMEALQSVRKKDVARTMNQVGIKKGGTVTTFRWGGVSSEWRKAVVSRERSEG